LPGSLLGCREGKGNIYVPRPQTYPCLCLDSAQLCASTPRVQALLMVIFRTRAEKSRPSSGNAVRGAKRANIGNLLEADGRSWSGGRRAAALPPQGPHKLLPLVSHHDGCLMLHLGCINLGARHRVTSAWVLKGHNDTNKYTVTHETSQMAQKVTLKTQRAGLAKR